MSADCLIFDVGAYLGEKTAQYVKAGAKVVCFEPNPASAAKIEKRFDSCVTVVRKAMGRKPGRTQLLICSKAPAISTCLPQWKMGRFRGYEWDRTVDVEVTTLDEAIAEYGMPNFAKIDVEGYELDVLHGLSAMIPSLSVEYAAEFRKATRQCVMRLAELGYRWYGLSRGKDPNVMGPFNLRQAQKLLGALKELDWGDLYAYEEKSVYPVAWA